MQIPIFEGSGVDLAGDFRTSYPENLMPVPKDTGVSKGYLRTVEGITVFGAIPGRDRAGIAWNGTLYRACGTKLCRVGANGAQTVVGDIGDNGLDAVFTFSFDRLAIASNGILWYYTLTEGLTRVTDPDAGFVAFVLWVDGYFVITDGITIAVTELNDPYSINPLKYGSAEESPDLIEGLLHVSGQLIAVGRLTNEYFQNIGGDLFPFQRLPNALIEKGAIGAYAFALYNQSFAFLGSGPNETPAVYMAGAGAAIKISTREVDKLIRASGGESTLKNVLVEARVNDGMNMLYVHLPTKSLVYDISSTALMGQPIWFVLNSGSDGSQPYRARNFTWVYDQWVCGDQQALQLGTMSDIVTTQFGTKPRWQFDTYFGFNEGKGVIFDELELFHNPGSKGSKAAILHMWSDDGKTFSMPRPAAHIVTGDNTKRTIWKSTGLMRQRRILRFQGVNDTPDSMAAIGAKVRQLRV